MTDPLSRTPFVKLLIPAVVGIVVSYNFAYNSYIIILGIVGVAIVGLSFAKRVKSNFSHRWLFGAGVYALIFAIFSFSTQQKIRYAKFEFDDIPTHYIGTVSNIPQEKQKSFSCNINLHHPHKKKVVAYIQQDEIARSLKPGDEIIFLSKVEPIKNFGNPDDFDYEKYMHNKGFSGSTYISKSSWQKTGYTNNDIITKSLRIRQGASILYKNLGLNDDAYSFISALTLGHKDDLSNELKEAFQSSGTSHILAVSGLHVGIIYTALMMIFTIFGRTVRHKTPKLILIIVILWLYAMLTGLSPSVTRAALMLTIALIGNIFNKRLFTYNVIAASAFIILMFNPLQIFDVGFQLSFAAVTAIVAINPILLNIFKPEKKLTKYLTNLFTVSLSAQIGVLPITLYYFGTFPTYFFISNLIIIPIIPFVIYLTIPTLIFIALANIYMETFEPMLILLKGTLEALIEFVLRAVYLIESLPASQFNDLHITILQTIMGLSTIALAIIFYNNRKPNHLIFTLIGALIISTTFLVPKVIATDDHIVVFNSRNRTDISMLVDNKKTYFETPINGYIPHSNKRILILSENKLGKIKNSNKLDLDILILSGDKSFDISQINRVFSFKQLIVDGTTPQYIRNKWIEECRSLNIDIHDVTQKGAFLIKL